MRAPSIQDVIAALATHRPADLAAALYAAHDVTVVENLIAALVDATTAGSAPLSASENMAGIPGAPADGSVD